MEGVWQDVRFGVRSLARHPSLTLVAVATLALGIGANTAIFSVVSAVLLRPLPYADQARIVSLVEKRPRENAWANHVSPADFLDWRERSTAFEQVAAIQSTTADLVGEGEPERVTMGAVSWSFFDLLGVKPGRGRLFRREDETESGAPVAVLSHGLWMRRFAGSDEVVGRRIDLGGVAHTVIGVLPEGFRFPDGMMDLWVPLYLGPEVARVRAAHFLRVIARLEPGVTLAQARAAMDTLGIQIEREHPDDNHGHYPNVLPFRRSITAEVRPPLIMLLGAVALVLLIACANVANLLLARGIGRTREMAVRTALGARRGRLLRLLLVESLLLAVAGGVLGFILAVWSTVLLGSTVPANLVPAGLRDFEPDAGVLAFTIAVSLLTGVLFGLAPALHGSHAELNEVLKQGGRGEAGDHRRGLRSALLVTQIALALVLLVGSGLLVRSFVRLVRVPSGFQRPETVLTAQVRLPRTRYDTGAKIAAFHDEVLARLRAIPEVESAGGVSQLPLTGQDNRSGIEVEGRPESSEPTRAHDRSISGDYFRAMGVRLLAGRRPDERDRPGRPLVVAVNETMARRYWPGEQAVGRRVRLMADPQGWREVVGVVEDVKHWGLHSEVRPEMYLPNPQRPSPFMNLVVRGHADPRTLVVALREQLRAVDPSLPLSAVATLEDILSESIAPRRFYMTLLAGFGTMAVGLACLGIYSVLSFSVARRTREIGIRIALGAGIRDVRRLVLGEGLRHTALGIGAGLLAAAALTRFLRAVLFGVTATDPATFAAVAIILAAVALMACWLPAHRASRVEPMTALRHE
jgi:predicted permease